MAFRSRTATAPAERAWIETGTLGDGTATVTAAGSWVLAEAGRLEGLVKKLRPPTPGGAIRVDLSGIQALDTAGALALAQLLRRLESLGTVTEAAGLDPSYRPLLDAVSKAETLPLPPLSKPHPLIAAVARIGRRTIGALAEGRDLLTFFGMVSVALVRLARRPGRLRLGSVVHHIEEVGLDALPIVGLLSFLIGIVLAYQGADQLRRFGAELYVVNLLGISVLREMGILLTAIIVAGRSGSAFTAQIGTMQINQEIDAMRTMGLDPVERLVLPRMAALVVALPLLAFYASALGLLGGALVSRFLLDINFSLFLRQLQSAVDVATLFVGLSKAPVFAMVIALVGCYEGLKVSGSADSVGRQTTQSVVVSIFLVIVLDALFSILFSSFGL